MTNVRNPNVVLLWTLAAATGWSVDTPRKMSATRTKGCVKPSSAPLTRWKIPATASGVASTPPSG